MNELKHANLCFIGEKDGFFIGNSFSDLPPKKSFATKLCIGVNSDLKVIVGANTYTTNKGFLIQAGFEHQLFCDKRFFLTTFHPISNISLYWKRSQENGIVELDNQYVAKLKKCVLKYLAGGADAHALANEVMELTNLYELEISDKIQYVDPRIENAISYIQTNINRALSVKEVADYCNLSQSRFLHLFKQQTGITFKRVELIMRLTAAFKVLDQQTITETAFQFGFSDSAHFSRIFKETMGLSPKEFLANNKIIRI